MIALPILQAVDKDMELAHALSDGAQRLAEEPDKAALALLADVDHHASELHEEEAKSFNTVRLHH